MLLDVLNNVLTEEGVALGRKLFYDPRLSGRDGTDGIRSCSSCHHQEKSFEYGTPTGTHHAMLPLINLAWNRIGLGWNGGVATLEDMVLAAVTSPVEINADTNHVVKYLQKTDDYPELFERAFGSRKITFVNVERAIAQFVRSLVSADSKFDRYLRGEEELTEDEMAGYELFCTEEGADCFHCHGGGGLALMTTNLFTTTAWTTNSTTPKTALPLREAIGTKVPTKPLPYETSPYRHLTCTTDASPPWTRSSTSTAKA